MSKIEIFNGKDAEKITKIFRGLTIRFFGDCDGFFVEQGFLKYDEIVEAADFLRSLKNDGGDASAAMNAIKECCKRPLGNMQVGGEHYQQAIQPVEYIHANGLPFIEGNVVKYISRHKRKGGAQDVEKAMSYCAMLLKMEYGYTDEQISKLYGK